MGKSIDEMLGDEPETQPEAVVEEAPEVVEEAQPETVERARGADGKFVSKEAEAPAEAPTDQLPREEYGVVRAIRDENKELKAQLAAIQERLSAQPQAPAAPPPSIWEDEQAWQENFGQTVAGQAAFNARLDTSEMLAAQAYSDFEEVRPKILEHMASNPALQQQVLGDRHPWNKAYQIVKNHEKMQALGAVDLDDLKSKLEAEIRAKLLEEAPQRLPSAPPTISGDRSVGSRTGPAWAGPKSIEEMLR
jgi:hypothetical protein